MRTLNTAEHMDNHNHNMLLTKCMDFAQHLNSTGLGFSLSITMMDGFSFSLDTREKTTSYGQNRKKLSPSAQRRNHRRRLEFLKKKGITSSGQPPKPVSPGNDLDPPNHAGGTDQMDLECSHCDTQWKSSRSLEMHVRKKHKDKNIPQMDGTSDVPQLDDGATSAVDITVKDRDNNRLEALENSVVNNYKRIEGIMTWKNDMENDVFCCYISEGGKKKKIQTEGMIKKAMSNAIGNDDVKRDDW